MQLIVNHLTRMQPGFFCTAGIEPRSGLHVRPVLPGGLKTELLRRDGGLFDIGLILDIGQTQFTGCVPEIEDRLFTPGAVRVVQSLTNTELAERCADWAKNSLREVFGSELQRVGRTAAIVENHGLVSLGVCWADRANLCIDDDPGGQRLRLHWDGLDGPISVAVADLRMYAADHRTILPEVVKHVERWLSTQPRVLLSVGLSRPYRKSENQPAMHWLQVNNIHYEM